MKEEERQKVLAYLLPYEKFSVMLYSEVSQNSPAIYIVKGNFGEYHGVFSWWQGSSIHHCLPDVYGKNRRELEKAFEAFFEQMSVKYLFSIVGEAAGCKMLKEILEKKFNKPIREQFDYFLMENGRFDSKTNLLGMNQQLKVETCGQKDMEKVFPLQAGFEKEEVIIEGAKFDEESCRAKFENFVDSGAVFVGKIKNVPLCKATINASGKNYVLIGGVYTLPAYRMHGLGKALINQIVTAMKDIYKKCTLFVKITNQPAIKLYEDCGFKKLCDYMIIYY